MNQNHLIAVVGGSGSGKGWLVDRLIRLLGEQSCHLSLDNFYRDRSHLSPQLRARLNFDTPRAIDWKRAERTIRDCRDGLATHVPRYDFSTHHRLPETTPWKPRPLVFVEGLSLLVRAPVRNLFDLKIYLDCPSSVRLDRRMLRDVAERGRSPDTITRQFKDTVAPMHARYVEPQKRWADLVLTQPFRKPDLLHLADRLWLLLTSASPIQPWMRVPFHCELLNLLECHDHNN